MVSVCHEPPWSACRLTLRPPTPGSSRPRTRTAWPARTLIGCATDADAGRDVDGHGAARRRRRRRCSTPRTASATRSRCRAPGRGPSCSSRAARRNAPVATDRRRAELAPDGGAAVRELERDGVPGVRGGRRTAHDHVVSVGDVSRLRLDLGRRRRRRGERLAGHRSRPLKLGFRSSARLRPAERGAIWHG